MSSHHVSIVESLSLDRPTLPARTSSNRSSSHRTKRCDADNYGTAEKQRSLSRFSLRRVNLFSRRQSSSAKSVHSVRSTNSEAETRSVSSMPSHADAGATSPRDDTSGRTRIECPLCLRQLEEEEFPVISTCQHRYCQDCLRVYLRIEIMENRTSIACPECSEKLHPSDVYKILDDRTLIEKYEEFVPARTTSNRASGPCNKRCDMDSYSTASVASKASREKQKSSSRFSLRRLNLFSRRQSSSAKSVHSVRSNNSEVETRSVSSLHYSHAERDASATSSREDASGRTRIECPLCLCQLVEDAFPVISTCHHRSCQDCLRQYLRIEIMESRVNIACPECAERFHPNDVYRILDDRTLIEKYEEFMLRRILVTEPDARWCPAPDCTYAVIASGCASCPRLKCERPGCDTNFCYHCKQYWHPNQTCDAARAERASNLQSSSVSYSHESNAQSEIKPCPRCGAFIIKMDDGSCNHMTCAVCGAEFCWLCMKEISDLHYLSPSGCTFWGKKPWSRKKKILWQLGTLVGAPVGIGLVAGIAIPAMIIGIPVWVGRKLHTKYEHSPKHKRNLLITGGVMASIVVSPILAGLAVGIGVPILLAYVYGVVPISLCRSGGCGVTTTDGGGVRFEFEEDNEVTVGISGPHSSGIPDAQSVDTHSHQVANPSIGPSIGEMSMGMTNSLSASGSHIDRVGSMRDESDRDSASNRALIGTSLNGSLSGSAVAGPSGFHNRMEVHADVATGTNKRNSLSSESANISLDAKSATVSFTDDASTKALAGSICTQDKDNTSAIIPPLEVHVDVLTSSAKYRRHSGSSNTETAMKSPCSSVHSNVQSPGSPTSTRSVSFIGEEVIGHRPSKRYKRQSLSVDDKINEQVEHSVARESVSVRSFMQEDCTLELGTGAGTCVGATDNLDKCCEMAPDVPPYTPPYPIIRGAKCSFNVDSVSPQSVHTSQCIVSISDVNPSELTEVESDRPSLCHSQSFSKTSDSSTETMSPDTISEPTLTSQNTRWSHSNRLNSPGGSSRSHSDSYLRNVP